MWKRAGASMAGCRARPTSRRAPCRRRRAPTPSPTARLACLATPAGARNDPVAEAYHAGLGAHAQPDQPDRAPLGVNRERHALAVDDLLPLTTDERSARFRTEDHRNRRAGSNPRVGPPPPG